MYFVYLAYLLLRAAHEVPKVYLYLSAANLLE